MLRLKKGPLGRNLDGKGPHFRFLKSQFTFESLNQSSLIFSISEKSIDYQTA